MPPPTSPSSPVFDASFAPRWTWRSVLLAAVLCAGIYLLLPAMELRPLPAGPEATLRPVDILRAPPPPLPPPPSAPMAPPSVAPPLPRPRLPAPAARPPAPSPGLARAGDRPLDASLLPAADFGDLAFALPVPSPTPPAGPVWDADSLDTPPRPLARLQPIYPPGARMRGLEGRVEVEFTVTPDGSVQDLAVLEARPGDLFTAAARRAIERWRFAPGSRDGEAVSARVRQTVDFRLEGPR